MKGTFTRLLLAYSTIGIQLAITILVFLYTGYLVDKHFNSSPIFVVVGTVLGMGVGFYNLMKGLSELDRLIKRIKEGKEDAASSRGKKWL